MWVFLWFVSHRNWLLGSKKGWSTFRFHVRWVSGCSQRCVSRGKTNCWCLPLKVEEEAQTVGGRTVWRNRGLTHCWISLRLAKMLHFFSRTNNCLWGEENALPCTKNFPGTVINNRPLTSHLSYVQPRSKYARVKIQLELFVLLSQICMMPHKSSPVTTTAACLWSPLYILLSYFP